MFSPAIKDSSIHVLLAMVCAFNLELQLLDVKTSFLHRELEEEICMSQSKGFLVPSKKNNVCLLKKTFYGLRQSPRQ